ncbi:ATP-dependent Clp protease ATP-binding subunit [Streptomyces sp. ME19-01-6]|uniref:ATP-dependent Clp protease ATP-binding subunit n=1 Tax=Streptomyces sp. ME19-01-6 TaxID=3028686 RepID=UPI0029B1EAAC|nr:ATP-dependent Clp protease ATP-binding subunit [Streptomyces sp. ME19-01-6]MDX3225302.1 ATP-dependent Clp protease ATP-binding subunit [Streptomyces sp. ME19-01-6]
MPYSDSVALALGLARIEARAGRAPHVEPEHLLLGLAKLCREDLREVLGASSLTLARRDAVEASARALRHRFALAKVDPQTFRRRLRAALTVDAPSPPPAVPRRSRTARWVFTRAGELAGGGTARAVDLLRAVLELPLPTAARVLRELEVEDARAAFFPSDQGRAAAVVRDHEAPRPDPEPDRPAEAPRPDPAPKPPAEALRRAPHPTPVLDKYGRDLTGLARLGTLPQLIGRHAELRTLARVLVRQRKANAVLVGHAGVGKTNIVEGLAARLTEPGAPAELAGARVVELSMAALLAGAAYRGEFEERLQAVLKEARQAPELILFIDEVHTVLGAGGKGASDAANILKPALARGDVRCLGATTPGEYRRSIESDPALQRRFEVVWVDEPGRDEAVAILEKLRESMATHHGVEIDADVPEAAVDLTVRHLPELRLPDKAIDMLDQACAAARIATLSPGPVPRGPVRVRPGDIAAAVAARARLPIERITAGEAERLLGMEEGLRRRVTGQDHAVRVVADAVRTARSGLGDPRRPVGVFLFAGPTGTGKTELAKALAEFLFDDERRLIRIDMSEYQERHSVSRLLGAPPGYLGHDREGQLSGPLRDHPHSVVLFDEVEKAHPEVLDIFLQIFDEGRLTDARGRQVSFTESIVILTSNLGARQDAEASGPRRLLGFAPPERPDSPAAAGQSAAERIHAALARELRPELLGRIGQVVVFEPLDEAALRRILDKVLDRVRARLADRSITIEPTEGAYDLLLARAAGARSGARALEQAVERLLVQPLGRALLAGRFGDGAAVRIDTVDGALHFTGTEPGSAGPSGPGSGTDPRPERQDTAR